MSVPERRAMVERPGETLSVRRQCTLLNLARSGVYRPGPATCADDLAMMRRIDELHLKWPFYGSRGRGVGPHPDAPPHTPPPLPNHHPRMDVQPPDSHPPPPTT